MLKSDRERIEALVLNAMQAKAEEMGVRGVAMVWLHELDVLDFAPKLRPIGRVERDPDPKRDTAEGKDQGTNYLSVVFSKAAEMFSTHMDSGAKSRPAKFGEFAFRGGVIDDDHTGRYFIAFSGGTEEQDVQIAEAGEQMLLSLE